MIGWASYDFWLQLCKQLKLDGLHQLSDQAKIVIEADNEDGYITLKANDIGKTWHVAENNT